MPATVQPVVTSPRLVPGGEDVPKRGPDSKRPTKPVRLHVDVADLAEKLAPVFAETAQPGKHDLVLVSGVGSVWPLLRAHSLLNNLHTVMGQTPLVLFYPGRYDGQSLRLFGKMRNNNYYRAFKLVP